MTADRVLYALTAILVFAVTLGARAYEVFQGPTELIQYDPARAGDGYTLFSPFRGSNTYLIDMHGEVVHYWPYPEWSIPGSEAIEKHARLLEDGTLLRGVVDKRNRGAMSGARYQIVNWESEVIWEYGDERPEVTPHHDFRMIWNPELQERTLLYVAMTDISHEEAVGAGVDPAGREDISSSPDGLVEVDMDGNILWEWNIRDHTVQDHNPELPNYGVVADEYGKMDPNFGGGVTGDWIHINSIDYNAVLDQIILNNSAFSESYVIDHGGTFVPGDPEESIRLAASDAGDFIFRWGNPCVYDAGDCPASTDEGQSSTNGHQQVFFSHDIQWIRDRELGPEIGDLPGAGNFLIFDNGSRRLGETFSSVLEFDPYDGPMENGVYIREMAAGHHPPPGGMGIGAQETVSKQVVWSYRPPLTNAFYSSYISGQQRLSNGNTLVCSGGHGHFFEITPEGEVVWEYVNPVGNQTTGDYGIYTIMTADAGDRFNSTFRCARYEPDYPGLQGKELVPMGQVTEIHRTEVDRPPR
ncbi:MAG TPA: aryl-sulfate sulfotransferase [Gammaproteobacteria bacterium]